MHLEAVAIVAFAAFVGGLLLFSRLISWIAGLALVLKSGAVERNLKVGALLAQALLHSGPWLLAIAIGCIWYVASVRQGIWLPAVLGGLAFAFAMLTASIAIGTVRRKRGAVRAALPLTEERLIAIRWRFFWGIAISSAGVGSALAIYMRPQLRHDPALIVMVAIMSLCFGFIFSWIMWQGYGAELRAREDGRRRKERKNAV